MAIAKKEMMARKKKEFEKAGLVPFSGYCYPDTKEAIKTMEEQDREKAGVPKVGR